MPMIDCSDYGAGLYFPPSQARMAIISVEAIVEESRWSLPEKPAIVGLRVGFQETEMLPSIALQLSFCILGWQCARFF
jgi:hypothetical protein